MRELTLPAPLMLLPGLGADGDLFGPQRQAFGDAVTTPDWIDVKADNESIGRYAERWAESINQQIATFRTDRPWFLSGMSMGGMLALELIPHLDRKPAAVFLISSARSSPAATWWAKLAAGTTGPLKPNHVALMVKLGAIPFGIRDGQDDIGYKLLLKMAKQSDPARLKWAIGATAEWTYPGPSESLPNGDAFPAIYQIHGRHDWLIPLREDDCDMVIDRGRHLINLSHATTVNRWLFDRITELCGIDESTDPRVEDPDLTVMRRPELAAQF
ncbi:alpha/beta fold hydrolase [Algisphaera agarilytica]|uniref:Pimeloyl-ACP methyl ester carboxylesterase n=1 Tax=Algisphaera agarilytica TaxID=1385975 RepID=A0A7X0H4U3_9BACT|nr:alpha/beta hydrolase [Algisphaera agarilytica]MBB6429052.1 pimeloyl-ACP methyl ester carboxylesterase [Algisphaera agarilytica]